MSYINYISRVCRWKATNSSLQMFGFCWKFCWYERKLSTGTMSHMSWRRNDHRLDTTLLPVEDPVKLADFRQLAQTRPNATGHWSSLRTSVVKRTATVVVSFAEIRGLYLAHSVFAHAVLPFQTCVVDAQAHRPVRWQFHSEGRMVESPILRAQSSWLSATWSDVWY